jgi:hypothetical protein
VGHVSDTGNTRICSDADAWCFCEPLGTHAWPSLRL